MSNQKTIREIVHHDICSVKSTTSVFETVQLLKEKNIGAVAIIDDEEIVGMFSERDLIKKVVCSLIDTESTPVGEVMTSPVITAKESTTYQEAYVLMNDNHIRHLPVVDSSGRPIGIVGLRDLMQGIMQDMIENFLGDLAA